MLKLQIAIENENYSKVDVQKLREVEVSNSSL